MTLLGGWGTEIGSSLYKGLDLVSKWWPWNPIRRLGPGMLSQAFCSHMEVCSYALPFKSEEYLQQASDLKASEFPIIYKTANPF